MSAIPTIVATSAPSVAELGDPSRAWAIVSAGLRSFLARVTSHGETARFELELDDAFDYAERRELVGDARNPRVAMQRQAFPVSHFGAGRIEVRAESIMWLAHLSERERETVRAALIPAWEGREHLRRAGSRIELAGAETKIEPR